MTFTSTEPQNHESENTWFTPKIVIKQLGEFDLDPCTMSFRPFDIAKTHYEFDKGQDGLLLPWYGRVYLNPPYGKSIMPFIDKFIEHKDGIMLIFARMGSEGVQKLLREGAYVYCLRNRIHFVHKDGLKKTNAGTDSIIVFFNESEIQYAQKLKGVLVKMAFAARKALERGE